MADDSEVFDLALLTAQRMLTKYPRADAIELAREQAKVLNRDDDFWQRVEEYLRIAQEVRPSRLNGSDFPKRCTGCDEMISAPQWSKLKFIGFQVVGPFDDDPGEVLDMRNHDKCGSTLAIVAPFTAAEFEQAVQQELSRTKDVKLAQQYAAERLRSK